MVKDLSATVSNLAGGLLPEPPIFYGFEIHCCIV